MSFFKGDKRKNHNNKENSDENSMLNFNSHNNSNLENETMNRINNPLFTSYSGKNNFTSSASFKSPSVWNCDWNLNNIPMMHIRFRFI